MHEILKKIPKKLAPLFVVAVLILVCLLFSFFGHKGNKFINYIYSSDMPIPVEKNNLYGYVSAKNGKELIPAKYSNAKQFYGNYAITELSEKGTTKYFVIDKKGNEKLSSNYRINYISDYGLYIIDDKLYNDNLKSLTDSNTKVSYREFGYCSYVKYDKNQVATEGGIINQYGKKIFKYKFKESENFFTCTISEADEKLGEFYAKVNVNNSKYAIINLKNGKIILDFTENSIMVDEDNIFKILSNTERKTICVIKNKIAFEVTGTAEVSYYDIDNKILQIYDSSKDYSNRYSYYDLNKKTYLSSKPNKEYAESISSLTGYNSFTVDGKHGIKKGKKVILPCEYDDIDFLPPTVFNYIKSKKNKELVLAKSNGIYSLINLKNKKSVFDIKTSTVDTYSTSTFIKAKLTDSNETEVYNMETKKSMRFDCDCTVNVFANYIVVTKGNTKAYYNTSFKNILNI